MKPYHIILLIILMGFGLNQRTTAQINISGLADFEIRMAGHDSSPYLNQTPGSGLSFFTPTIRLFFSANLSEQWFVNGSLQADHYEGKKLSSPFFSVMNINWTPNFDSKFLVTAGRFVTPYGSYSTRFLSNVNPFVHLPLSHAGGLPVSNRFGHLQYTMNDPSSIKNLYGGDEKGINMVYQRMYTQGIKVSHSFGESSWLSLDVAATNAPVSSQLDFNEHQNPSWIGRAVFKPVIWAELGFSYSKGAFLLEDEANDTLRIYSDSGYPNTTIGSDLKFNYRYYTLLIEWNQSFFKAPFYDPTTSTAATSRTGKATIDHFSGEFIYDFPFAVGGYAGIRYEQMTEGEIEIYRRDANNDKVDQSFTPWVFNRERFEFVAGYKLQRNVILKISYLLSSDDGAKLDDNVFAVQLSALF
ncbi:MAG: hypothetical protein RLN90_02660 [Balneolaceae bacterium]